jgi:hypothetical protein
LFSQAIAFRLNRNTMFRITAGCPMAAGFLLKQK